jgi:phosphatidylserine/phosphatidylglycerophosphate/cardiolipin synthase-like enzyme
MTRSSSGPRTTAQVCSDRFVFAPDERLPAVLGVIGSARKRLLLSLFRCDDFEILDALAASLQRGVSVEVLVTPRAKGWTKRLRELWAVLEGMGAKLHRYADPVVKYHAKYIVADDGPALVASLNFTRKCFTSTVDFLVTTRDPIVVAGLGRLFDADSRRPEPTRPAAFGRRLIVGPEHARHEFTRLLERARRSIAIVDPKLTDPAILDLLKAKRSAGVAVRVLGREGMGGLSAHGKMLLVDEAVGAIGGMSLSALSLDFRREVAVIVRDRECVGEMARVFERLAAPPAARRPKPIR